MTVESVAVKRQENDPVHVIFVATVEGVVKKIGFNTKTKQSCLIEVLRPFESPTKILNMQLLPKTNSLYISTDFCGL